MKANLRQTLLPAVLLGGILSTLGCRAPTLTVGAPKPPNRLVVSVSSPAPANVQCVWLQDGARIQHRHTTPFRLVMPYRSVHEIRFSKPGTAGEVAVEILSPAAKPGRFIMTAGSNGVRWARAGRSWEALDRGS